MIFLESPRSLRPRPVVDTPLKITDPLYNNGAFIPNYQFTSFLHSFFTGGFQTVTLENWNNTFYYCWRATHGFIAQLYFYLVLFLGFYILVNLFISILLSNFAGLDAMTLEAQQKQDAINAADLLMEEADALLYKQDVKRNACQLLLHRLGKVGDRECCRFSALRACPVESYSECFLQWILFKTRSLSDENSKRVRIMMVTQYRIQQARASAAVNPDPKVNTEQGSGSESDADAGGEDHWQRRRRNQQARQKRDRRQLRDRHADPSGGTPA